MNKLTMFLDLYTYIYLFFQFISGELVTKPDERYFTVVEQDQFWRVSLRDPPRELEVDENLALLHSRPELIEFHKYTKRGNPKLSYEPHTWPVKARRGINTKLNVHMLPESYIYHYAFVSIQTLWEWVQLLAENGIANRPKLPLPSILLMTLLRVRRGFTLKMCALEFEFSNEANLDELFYACATILVDNLLTVPRLWCSSDVTEQDQIRYFENLMENTDPLFKLIAGNFADVTGMIFLFCMLLIIDILPFVS